MSFVNAQLFKTILLVLGAIFVSGLRAPLANAQPTTFYFSEADGENRNIFYKAFCVPEGNASGRCSLRTIAVSNAKSLIPCTISVETLIDWAEAKKQGEVWTVSSSAGACRYINTYQISETGMIQIKSAPKKKALSLCEEFAPKTYSMKFHPDVSSIKLGVKGCDSLGIQSLN